MPELPTGTVTFLFTDVEGSTRLWEEHASHAGDVLKRHDEIFETTVERAGGVVVRPRGEGDSRFAVFARATDAVAAALNVQLAFAKESWPVPLRVRMAIHTGEADLRAGDYYGPAVNRCARIRAIAHGGQTLVASATEELVRGGLPAGASLRDLGAHRLRDLSEPARVFQLCHTELRQEFPPLRSLEALPNNLPVQLTNFVGRDEELGEVRTLVDGARLVTLTGAAGCGKTRLALHVGAELLDANPEGVWFVDLAPVADPDLVPREVAGALGLREETGRPLFDTLVEFLRDRRLVLILDNCEHLLEACARTATDLLRACPELRILATGREALGVSGETTWRVPSLGVPDAGHGDGMESLAAFDAVRLFVYRARAVAPGITFTDEDAPVLTQICRRLDGIPLALELAAARTDFLTLDQIAARLDDRFRLLTGGSRTALERQQTLRAALDWSYALLGPKEKTLFRRMAVFVGGFTLEACEDVCSEGDVAREEVLDLIGDLARKSLVVSERRGREGRYRLLETMRQYAREKLADSLESDEMRTRHLAWYRALAEAARAALKGPEAPSWLRRLEGEHDNLRAALEWATRPGVDGEDACVLADGILEFWTVRGYWTEGRDWLERVLATQGGTTLARTRALNAAAQLASQQGDLDEAEARTAEAMRLAQELGAEREEAVAYYRWGVVAHIRGDNVRRDEMIARALDIFTRIGERVWTAGVYNALGIFADGYEDSLRLFEQAIAVAREAGDIRTVAMALVNLGGLAAFVGRYEQAHERLEEARGLLRDLEERALLAASYSMLALIAFFRGDYETARPLYAQAEALGRELGGNAGATWARASRAQIAFMERDYATARTLHEESLALYRARGARPAMAQHLMLLGHIALVQHDVVAARASLEESLAIREQLGESFESAATRTFLALLERIEGNDRVSAALFRQALKTFGEQGAKMFIGRCLDGLGGLAAASGDGARAARLMGAAEEIRGELRAQVWPAWRAMYDADVATARAACAPGEFARAWAEGRAMTLDEAVTLALEGARSTPELHQRR